jgi:hypothetical protein
MSAMGILKGIYDCLAREIIEQDLPRSDCQRSYRRALIPGWDFIEDLSAVDAPSMGIWRTAHLEVRQFFDTTETIPLGMFDVETVQDLEARLWRLLKIYPDPFEHRYEPVPMGLYLKSSEARELQDIFAPLPSSGAGPERGTLIDAVIGSTPQEIARFCFDLTKSDPKLGRLLLTKRFRDAMQLCPDIVDMPWPTYPRFKRKYLPPFQACILLGEMQRLAQNVCSQIQWSFFLDGNEATIAQVSEACLKYQKKRNAKRRASDIYDPCISQVILQAPFQTRLHQFAIRSDQDVGLQQVYATSRELFLALMQHGEPLIDFITGLDQSSPSPGLAKNAQAHVAWLPNRKAKRNSAARNPEHAMLYWGMSWYDHAVLGLAQIHSAARAWNREYYPQNPWPLQGLGSSWSLQQAIARIPYLWLETISPKAFEREAHKLCRARERNSRRGEDDRRTHEETEEFQGSDPMALEKLNAGEKLIATLAVFDDPNVKIKDRAVTSARNKATERPRHGYPGYSAQYRPHLWIDREHDDIGFWIGREREICSRLCPLADLQLQSLDTHSAYRALLNDVERYREGSPSIRAKVAQNLAMTPSSFATDPMHLRMRVR